LRHHRRFWRNWQEACQHFDDEESFQDFDPRLFWRKHFAEFLGKPPEQHWLFGGRRFRSWVTGELSSPGLFNPFLADLMSKGGGLLGLLTLHLLSEQPRYGNDIMREIQERTNGGWESNPGAIYPLLTLMEHSKLVEGEWEDQEKRTRRVYRLTSLGFEELTRLKEVMRPKMRDTINVLRNLYGGIFPEED
jgi:PadR family transcriptional regulator PadR